MWKTILCILIMKQIKLNGLLWDAENIKAYGYEHFDWESACQLAADNGKRLPTIKELKDLYKLPNVWDSEKKGYSLSGREEDLMCPDNSLFLPAAGFRSNSNGQLYNSGITGNYWSASTYGDFSFYFYFSGGNVIPANINSRAHGFSVRLVEDI